MKNWWLYVLKLEQGKWYVGITSQTPQARFEQHKRGIWAADWTKEYKPVAIEYAENLGGITKDRAEEIEHNKARDLMREYGWQNVRGGRFRSLEYKKRFGILWRVNIERDMPSIETLHSIYAVLMLSLVILLMLLDR